MALSVAVHKDIGEYQEKIVGKLSARTLACVAGGLATSVATAAGLNLLLGISPADASGPVMAVSVPFWLLGFWRPHGMRAEEFLPLLWAHLFGESRLAYVSSDALEAPPARLARKTTRKHRRKSRRKGAELREPTEEEEARGRR